MYPREEPKEINNEAVRVACMCPGNLYSLFKTTGGLQTNTANQIEAKISGNEIKNFQKSIFFFLSTLSRFEGSKDYLEDVKYAGALCLISEKHTLLFEREFAFKSSIYSLYHNKFAVETGDQLYCYVLPLEKNGNKFEKTISKEVNSSTISSYKFKICEDDARYIKLENQEIIWANMLTRENS